jgi:hypothetical protein
MRQHFCDLHPQDYVTIPREGRYPRCPCCGMHVDPRYLAHINTKECWAGMERRHKQDMAVQSALALYEQYTVHRDVLEKFKVYQYLGSLLLQNNDDFQAMRSQLLKARGTGQGLDRCCVVRMHRLGLVQHGNWAVRPPIRKQEVGPEQGCHG